MNSKVSKYLIMSIIVSAVILRIAAVIIVGNVDDPEGWEYSRIAEYINEGKGYVFNWFEYEPDPPVPSAIEGPLYTYFLVGAFQLPYQYWFIEIFQAIVWGGVVWLIYLIGRGFRESRAVSIFAAAIVAFFPAFIYSPTQVHHTSFSMLLILAIIYFATHLRRKRAVISGVGFGVTLGLYLLAEPVGAVFAATFALWSLVKDKKRAIIPVAVAATVSLIIIAPWMVRNIVILDYPFFIKSTSGQTLWIGNNENATGTTRNAEGASVFYRDIPDDLKWQLIEKRTEKERHLILQNEAVKYIVAHPITTLKRDLWRIKLLWTGDPNHPLDLHPLNIIPTWVILGLGIIGLILVAYKRRLSDYAPAITLWISFTALYAVVLVVSRYRFPLIALMAIPAALFIVEAVKMFTRLIKKKENGYK